MLGVAMVCPVRAAGAPRGRDGPARSRDKRGAASALLGRTVRCWGDAGVIGDGTDLPSPVPVAVVGLDQVATLATGYTHMCALNADSTLWCWGRNLGDCARQAVTRWSAPGRER